VLRSRKDRRRCATVDIGPDLRLHLLRTNSEHKNNINNMSDTAGPLDSRESLHLYVDSMAKASGSLHAPAASTRRPDRRGSGRWLAAVLAPAFLVAVLAGPSAHAQTPPTVDPSADQARARRQQIAQEQAQIAANLQPLTATDAQINAAVQATAANVASQQAKVNDAQRAADEAQANADKLAAQQAAMQQQVDGLKQQVRDRAVAAYINPQGDADTQTMLLQTDDLNEAERKRELVESVTGSQVDATDQLRSAEQALDQTRANFAAAADDARARKADLDADLTDMKAAYDQQAKVKSLVDQRIAGYQKESSTLQAEDENLQKTIADAEARYQAQQQAFAQQQAAAAAAAAKAQPAAPLPSTSPSPAAAEAAPPNTPAPAPTSGGFIWPVNGTVSQEYGHNGHPGIDIAAPLGTPVVAAKSGVVISAGWNSGGYGNLILIDTGDVVNAYAHLSAIGVSAGQTVSTGQFIGNVGSTGESTGPHLHFECRVNGHTVNPRNFLP
jgi:septal ring factor EnvC (AmiA/AmiB activator)